jgi:hypothetical protein
MNFQENTSNGNRDTAEKADYSPSKVSLIIDPSQPNLHGLYGVRTMCKIYVYIFIKTSPMETEVQAKKRIALQATCTELLTYRNQTCQVCNAGAEDEWYVISQENASNGSSDTDEKHIRLHAKCP